MPAGRLQIPLQMGAAGEFTEIIPRAQDRLFRA
jgi:hypothetical protein